MIQKGDKRWPEFWLFAIHRSFSIAGFSLKAPNTLEGEKQVAEKYVQ